MEVSEIVRNLVDYFVVLGSKIKRTPALALVQDTGVVIQELTFNGSMWEALKDARRNRRQCRGGSAGGSRDLFHAAPKCRQANL